MTRPAPRRTRRTLTTAAVVVLAAAVGAGSPAQAATTASVGCTARATAQKFKAVDGDPNAYFTAPGGTFESGATGWTLSGASVVAGNESRYVNGSGHAKSLQVLWGGRAVSPIFCNQYGERSIRFFYKGTVGARVHLHIDVTNSATDNRSTLDWEAVVPLLGWGTATAIMVPDLYSQGYENLQLTFTAVAGTVVVDDVEIDPFKPL